MQVSATKIGPPHRHLDDSYTLFSVDSPLDADLNHMIMFEAADASLGAQGCALAESGNFQGAITCFN